MEKGAACEAMGPGRDGGRRGADTGAGAGEVAERWPPSLPPWGSPSAWRAVTAALDHHLGLPHIRNHRSARRKAAAIADLIARLDPPMARLSRATCPDCSAPCCLHATLWYDLADLLMMGFARLPWPEGQPMAAVGAHCRYLGPAGCRLPRIRRPWICTWYLCPRQTARLKASRGSERHVIEAALAGIKQLRKGLERDFIAALSAPKENPEASSAPDLPPSRCV